jgi:TctA family transporter
MVGIDPYTSQAGYLWNPPCWVNQFVVVMIGLFGLSESLAQLKNKEPAVKQKVDKIIPD